MTVSLLHPSVTALKGGTGGHGTPHVCAHQAVCIAVQQLDPERSNFFHIAHEGRLDIVGQMRNAEGQQVGGYGTDLGTYLKAFNWMHRGKTPTEELTREQLLRREWREQKILEHEKQFFGCSRETFLQGGDEFGGQELNIEGAAEVGPLKDVRMVQPGTIVLCETNDKTNNKLGHFMAVKSVTDTKHLVCWDVMDPDAFQNLANKGESSIRSLALVPSPRYPTVVATYWLKITAGRSMKEKPDFWQLQFEHSDLWEGGILPPGHSDLWEGGILPPGWTPRPTPVGPTFVPTGSCVLPLARMPILHGGVGDKPGDPGVDQSSTKAVAKKTLEQQEQIMQEEQRRLQQQQREGAHIWYTANPLMQAYNVPQLGAHLGWW